MTLLNKLSHQEHNHLQKQLQINDFHRYYPLCSIPETIWCIEQEYWQGDRSQNQSIKDDCSTNKNPTSTSAIIIALGFITTLLCLTGVGLNRSINIESANAENQTLPVWTGN